METALNIDSGKKSTILQDGFLVVMGSLLIALFAKISIPLPFTPVPIAFQPHICLLLGALLGSKRGALSVLFYLIQGVLGLPVFALGASGIAILLGPRGGYLLGYVVATFLVGYLFERQKEKKALKTFSFLALGNMVIYAFGVTHLATFVGKENAIYLGLLPFLLADLFKLGVVCLALVSKGQHFLKHLFRF